MIQFTFWISELSALKSAKNEKILSNFSTKIRKKIGFFKKLQYLRHEFLNNAPKKNTKILAFFHLSESCNSILF